MHHLLHALQARGSALVMWRLVRYARVLMEIMMVASPGIFVFFNGSHHVEPPGTHGGSGVILSRETEARVTGHMAAPELP
jgi:hypothetical protein